MKDETSLMSCLADIEDPRRPSNGMLHDFQEILVIAVAGMLSDCDTVEDITFWAQKKEAWLRQFLWLKHGIPSGDTFLRVFRLLNPQHFEAAFRRWVSGVVGALNGTIAVDGKTLCGSGSGGESPIHMVSAFATELGLVLGQEKVSGKSNEITAIPELLESLYIKGLLVSIDAMGCQKNIARQITTQGGDYLLMVKANQATLLNAIKATFVELFPTGTPDSHRQTEQSHGRVVHRIATVLPAQGVVDTSVWPNCKTLGRIDSIRQINGETSTLEQRYYISSRALTGHELAVAVRSHWAIENQLHWVLDVNFGEDNSMIRKDNAPQNLSLLKKIVLNILRSDTTQRTKKTSLRLKRKAAAWDDETRQQILGLRPLC